MFVFRPDNRMARGGNELRLEADLRQLFHQPMRAFGELFVVGVVGRDARKTQESEVLFEIRIAHPED